MKSVRARLPLIEVLEARTLLTGDFTIISMSDSQYVVERDPPVFRAQTQWIADHAADPAYNIAFMAMNGDMLRRGYSDAQCAAADSALDNLNAIVPYGVAIGNHDYDNSFDDLDHHISSANFTSWFGDDRYNNISGSGFGGSSLDQRNNCFVINAGGRQLMILNMEWEAPDAAIAWAQGVLNAHRDLPVMLMTHEYLRSSGRSTTPLDPAGNSGDGIFQKLVRLNPQIFFVVSGHTGAVYHQTSSNASTNADYRTVWETVSDFEGRSSGASGYFQLFHFYPDANTVSVSSFSPTLGVWDTTSACQYSLNIDFAKRFGFADSVIANDDTFDTLPGAQVSGDVIANDHEPAGLALSATRVASPTHGTLSLNPDGSFTYTPAAGFRGNDTFTYTVSNGANTSNLATVTLRVNSAPVAAADDVMVAESRSVVINAVGNDMDADGDALRPILRSLPAHGAVFANAAGTITYTPDPKFVGQDGFTYVATDRKVVSTPVQVNVTVMYAPPVYDYPISETTVTGSRVGSLANVGASDGVEETINETSANPGKLDHRWQFNVTGGAEVSFCIKARRGQGSDEYRLKYSTDGTSFYDMTQYVPASSRDVTRVPYDAGEPYQMWQLPSSTKGNLWIRATDSITNTDLSSLAVDEMFVRSVSPPQDVNVVGTSGPDLINVSFDGSMVSYGVNEQPTHSVPQGSIASFTIDGAGGDDVIIVDLSRGNPFPSGVTIRGGDGTADAMILYGLNGEQVLTASPMTVGGATISYAEVEKVGFGDGDVSIGSVPAGLGLVAVGTARVNLASPMHLPILEISDAAIVKLAGSGTLLRTPIVSIAGGATLDVADGDLIVDAADADAAKLLLASLTTQISLARNSDKGLWKGSGITSSSAAADPDRLHGVGILLNDTGRGDPIHPQWGTESLNANCAILTNALNGDMDLNGRVNTIDYARIDQGFLSQGSADPLKGYQCGDLDYSAKINTLDYSLIDSAFLGQSQAAPAPQSRVSAPKRLVLKTQPSRKRRILTMRETRQGLAVLGPA